MGYGISRKTHRIELKEFDGSDNWVDIKADRSNYAASREREAMFTLTAVNADLTAQFSAKMDMTEARLLMFEHAIVAWSLKEEDDDDHVMPLGRLIYANMLIGDVADFLDRAISAYYKNRRISEDDLKNSNGTSSAPSKG